MWVASFLRLILASRYQVGVWPIEVFPHSQTHDLAKDLAMSQDLRKWPKSGVLRGQNLGFWGSKSGVSGVPESGQKVPESRDFKGLWPPINWSDLGIWDFVVCAGSEWPRKHEKKCLLANVGQKNTVSWGIVHAKPKIGPLLGRSFEKWNVL